MAIWRCYSASGMSLVDSPENPSNSARQCVLESGSEKELPEQLFPRIRSAPEKDPELDGQRIPYREQSRPVAYTAIFKALDPVGPTPDDPFSDPTMADVFNPPSSPTTNILKGPWAGQLNVTGNTGIDPKFSFASLNADSSYPSWMPNYNWIWLIVAGVVLYAWSRTK